jgi:serine/threonine-protein kinase
MKELIRTNVILNERYQIRKLLAQGGMGAIYLAWDILHRRHVAIKVAYLHVPEARAQFRREADYLQRLSHHSLPRVWEVFSDTQRDFLVMEYIPGNNLEDFVNKRGKQPEWLVLRWADELLDALIYLHSQNPPILHRDIKPGNLKLRQDDTLVLVDFGIATEYLPHTSSQSGVPAVSPGYSPPEQYISQAVIDVRSDIYAVGATLYFLLTGRVPPPSLDRAQGNKKLIPIQQLAPDVSVETQELVQRAMAIHREERWANAIVMRRAVSQAAGKLATRSTKPAAWRKSPGTLSMKGIARVLNAWTILMVGGVIAVILGLMSWPRTQGETPSLLKALFRKQPIEAMATPALSTPIVNREIVPEPGGTIRTGGIITSAGGVEIPGNPPRTPVLNVHTVTPAATPTAVAIIPPTSTPVRLTSPTPTATATGTIPPLPRATATKANIVRLRLLRPEAGASAGESVTCQWEVSDGSLAAEQGLELLFWPRGKNPLQDGIRLSEPIRDLKTTRWTVSLIALPAGEYEWGIVLVQLQPYRRLRLVSDSRLFRVRHATPSPTPTSPPPPTPTSPPPPTPTPQPTSPPPTPTPTPAPPTPTPTPPMPPSPTPTPTPPMPPSPLPTPPEL